MSFVNLDTMFYTQKKLIDTIKKDKRLKDMALVRIGRLSVQPVTDKEHDVILELAGEKK